MAAPPIEWIGHFFPRMDLHSSRQDWTTVSPSHDFACYFGLATNNYMWHVSCFRAGPPESSHETLPFDGFHGLRRGAADHHRARVCRRGVASESPAPSERWKGRRESLLSATSACEGPLNTRTSQRPRLRDHRGGSRSWSYDERAGSRCTTKTLPSMRTKPATTTSSKRPSARRRRRQDQERLGHRPPCRRPICGRVRARAYCTCTPCTGGTPGARGHPSRGSCAKGRNHERRIKLRCVYSVGRNHRWLGKSRRGGVDRGDSEVGRCGCGPCRSGARDRLAEDRQERARGQRGSAGGFADVHSGVNRASAGRSAGGRFPVRPRRGPSALADRSLSASPTFRSPASRKRAAVPAHQTAQEYSWSRRGWKLRRAAQNILEGAEVPLSPSKSAAQPEWLA